MQPSSRSNVSSATRTGIYGAISTIAGIVLSGPLAVALVNTTHPQPPWAGPALFARSFHPIQVIYTEANGPILTAFSMSNPKSLAWALEMWGWGFLGVATWLVAPVFRGSQLERATCWTFVANGPVSIAGAVWTVLEPGWMMTTPGLVAFALWNILLLVMAVLALVAFRRRARAT